jgi:hypothetical protein
LQFLRLLDRQAVVLAELRTRASIVLSAIGIVSALMGTAALTGAHPHAAGITGLVVALGSLVMGLRSCIVVLWPVGRGEPSTKLRRLRRLFRRHDDGYEWGVALLPKQLPEIMQLDNDATARWWLYDMLKSRPEINYRIIDLRTDAFNWACITLIAQVLGWSLALLFR